MVSALKLVEKVKLLARHKLYCYKKLLSGSDKPPYCATPVGFLPVYVGEEKRRLVIPVDFLSHPLFRMLLEKAYIEYRFEQQSGLSFPCTISIFQEVVSAVESFHGQFNMEKLVVEFTDFAFRERAAILKAQEKRYVACIRTLQISSEDLME